MPGGVATLTMLVLASGPAPREAGGCLPVWLDVERQAAECAAVHTHAVDELTQNPRVCLAGSQKKAVVSMRLTRCVQQEVAAVAPEGARIAGRELVIWAEVAEGRTVKQLAGRDSESWARAMHRLCHAILVWHGNEKQAK